MRRFRTIWKWLVPGWLQKDEGELVQYTLGFIHDAFAERCRQTPWLMWPSLAPSDALARIGKDRLLERGLFEPEASYRARLIAWRYPRGHRVRGSALALLEQVTIALRGLSHTTIDARGTKVEMVDGEGTIERGFAWDWDGQSTFPNWGRYWIVVESSGAPWPTFAEGAWGPTVGGNPDICIAGSGIHPGEVAAVRKLVDVTTPASWTPAGRRPIYLVIYFTGDAFPAPDGTWDVTANRDDTYRYVPLHTSIS